MTVPVGALGATKALGPTPLLPLAYSSVPGEAGNTCSGAVATAAS